MRYKLLCIVLVCCSWMALSAINKQIQTSLLREMSELLLVHHIDVAANDSCIYYGKKIIVEANDTLISDIRFKLFEDSTRLCLMPEISKFVERYLLYLSLLPSSERSKVINDDHVIFDYSTLRLLNSDLDLNLEFADNRYTIEWKNDSQVVSILTFPNQYELISGMNKIESGAWRNSPCPLSGFTQ